MFNPGDLVKVSMPYGDVLALIIGWAASSNGMNLWWLNIKGVKSHYYFFDNQLEIVSKVNIQPR